MNPEVKQTRKEFSKWLLIQETALIWITTIVFLILAFVCIWKQYFGELPWLAAMAAFPWTAYGVSQAFYYKKAMAENTVGGIKYESTFATHPDNDEQGDEFCGFGYEEDAEEAVPETENLNENAEG